MLPYNQSQEEICQSLQTNHTEGLTLQQAQQNLKKYGRNELTTTHTTSIFVVFFSQFADPLTYVLFGAAAIIFVVGESLDAWIIGGILIFNAIVGTVQEKRTEKILQSLQAFFTCESLVIRNGEQHIISNDSIVPGDLISLSPGEKIPADARIISATNLTTDESALTGESTTAVKSADIIAEQDTPISEQHNIAFAGTYVLTGSGTAIVFGTGKNSQAGKIHAAVETVDTNTPLKKDLAQLSRWIFIFIFFMCSSLFLIGLAHHKPIIELLVMITALFICVIPEGLPVVLTIISVSGAYKMAQRDILVKRIKAIESLGRIDVIITDKTGTLTRNEMVVSTVYVEGEELKVSGSGYFVKGSVEQYEKHKEVLDRMALACALLNDTQIEFDEKLDIFKIKGNPTQAASFVFAQKISPEIISISEGFTKTYSIPFDTAYKYAAVFCKQDNSNIAFVLGASEVVVAACKNQDPKILIELEKYLEEGYRVIAIAQKIYQPGKEESMADYHDLIASDLEFLGLLAISDEPRENLAEVIKQVTKAKIQIIVATGDHPSTALHIAQKVGIVDNATNFITSQDFEKLDDAQVLDLFKNNNFVCARFLPQDKLRLVKIFKNQGKIVATTGDGINDVPALVASDVSIAMGSSGAQMTKETADIVLTRDSFENIIYAIQQGQIVFQALRRSILYFLTSNATEVFIIFFALVSNIPLPLLPAQILLLNLMTDGFLDAALAMEPVHVKSIKISPKENSRIFDNTIMRKVLYLALPASFMSFAVFYYAHTKDLALARTITFTTLIMFQWFNALNCRSENKSIFQIGLFSNFWLMMATLTVFAAQIVVIYTPFMQHIFKTVPLSLHHWLYAAAIASSVLFMEEVRKYVVQRFFAS